MLSFVFLLIIFARIRFSRFARLHSKKSFNSSVTKWLFKSCTFKLVTKHGRGVVGGKQSIFEFCYTGVGFRKIFEDCLMECKLKFFVIVTFLKNKFFSKLKIYKCLQTKFTYPTTIMHSAPDSPLVPNCLSFCAQLSSSRPIVRAQMSMRPIVLRPD